MSTTNTIKGFILSFISSGLILLVSGCASTCQRQGSATEHQRRQAHIAMHHGHAKAADAMAKVHGSHKKAHVHMHQGKYHEAEHHAKTFSHAT